MNQNEKCFSHFLSGESKVGGGAGVQNQENVRGGGECSKALVRDETGKAGRGQAWGATCQAEDAMGAYS